MGFTQLSNITNGTYNLGQLLFTGKIGAQGQPDGSFEKINNNKYFGSNSARLTAAQNSTTRTAVVSTLNAEFSNKEGVGTRLDAIKDYLTGVGQTDKALYREEVGAMIKILNDGGNLSADAVKAKLYAVRAEQEFKQLRKMTVDSTFGLGNIVMTKGSGQFEKVNNHKIKKDANNIDLSRLGGADGAESAWLADSETRVYIADVLRKHFTPEGENVSKDKTAKLKFAFDQIEKRKLSLSDRQTLSGVIRFLESPGSKTKADFEKFVPNPQASQAKQPVKTNQAEVVNAAPKKVVDKDAECAKLFGALAKKDADGVLDKAEKMLIASYGGSDKLSRILLSPLGRHAVAKWPTLDENKKEDKQLKKDLKAFFVKVAKCFVGRGELEDPVTRGVLFKDEAEVMVEEDDDFTRYTGREYANRFDYFMTENMPSLVDNIQDTNRNLLLEVESNNIFKCELADGKHLKDFINPPPFVFYGNNADKIKLMIGKDAIFKAIAANPQNAGILSKTFLEKNNSLASVVKGVGAAEDSTANKSAVTEVDTAKTLGLPTRGDYVKIMVNGSSQYKESQKALKEAEAFEKDVASFAKECGLEVGVTSLGVSSEQIRGIGSETANVDYGDKYNLYSLPSNKKINVSEAKMASVSKDAKTLIDKGVKFIEKINLTDVNSDGLKALKKDKPSSDELKQIIECALDAINGVTRKVGQFKLNLTTDLNQAYDALVALKQIKVKLEGNTFRDKGDSKNTNNAVSSVAQEMRDVGKKYGEVTMEVKAKEIEALQKLLADVDIQNMLKIEADLNRSNKKATVYMPRSGK